MLVAIEDRTGSPLGGQGMPEDNTARGAGLSAATVADLAQEMWVPEGLFRAVIERYPELNRVLARRYRASTCTA